MISAFEKGMCSKKYKCHLLLSADEILKVNIGAALLSGGKCEKFLGVKIDNKLSFDEQIGSICKKASEKLNALSRVTKYMGPEKKCFTMNAFFSVLFSYCSFIWMFHNKSLNHKINRLHERF